MRESPNVHPLRNRKVLITAGPTREYWDPIRYLSNGSSGQMGMSLALEAVRRGARAIVILGPTPEKPPRQSKRLRIVPVVSAAEMRKRVHAHLPGTHVFIGAAAVADYRPAMTVKRKIKGKSPVVHLKLLKNPDIIAEVARPNRNRPSLVVGFALETQHVIRNAESKLRAKGLDWVIANRRANLGAPQGSVTLISRVKKRIPIGRMTKERLARRIWTALLASPLP